MQCGEDVATVHNAWGGEGRGLIHGTVIVADARATGEHMRVYEYKQFGLDNLALVERDEPRAAAHEAVVKFHAASLNYRDLLFAAAANWPLARAPHLLETSLPGVFAVGDVRGGSLKRVASAVGEGSIAVALVHRVLHE